MDASTHTAELARGWITAWIRMDLDWLRANLAEDFTHTSPFGRLSGRDAYLDTVAPIASSHAHELVITDVVADGDRAVVRFDNRTPRGTVPTCDWVVAVDERIASVHSFYDSTLLREVLSANELRTLGRNARVTRLQP